jgi:hypothetical protein
LDLWDTFLSAWRLSVVVKWLQVVPPTNLRLGWMEFGVFELDHSEVLDQLQ